MQTASDSNIDSTALHDTGYPAYASMENELKSAGNPFKLPPKAWWNVLERVAVKFGRDNLAVVAAGCSFFTLMALVPLLTSVVLLYGLLADATQAANHFELLFVIIPGDGATFLRDRMMEITQSSEPALSLGLAVSVFIAIWSSANAMRAVLNAMNIVYDETEDRSFLSLNLRIMGFTLLAILVLVFAQLLISVVPVLLSLFGFGSTFEATLTILRWPLLAFTFFAALFILYRRAPSRSLARWNWVVPGSLFATLAWLGASALFSLYISSFANFDAVYGSFGAIIVLLLWLHWTYLIVLVGAELNSELEREIICDTTTGEPAPLGERNAVVADTVAMRPDL